MTRGRKEFEDIRQRENNIEWKDGRRFRIY